MTFVAVWMIAVAALADKAGGFEEHKETLRAGPAASPSAHTLAEVEAAEVEAAFATVQDPQAPAASRTAACMRLQLGEWTDVSTEFRDRHRAVLRKLATDPQANLRALALENLMLHDDAMATELLIDGLDGRRPPLVDNHLAARMLAGSAQAWPTLRRLVTRATGPTLEAAVRSLTGDTESIPLFRKLLTDKHADINLRGTAGANLAHTDAKQFAEMAPDMVLSSQEPLNLRLDLLTHMTFQEDVRIIVDTPTFRASLVALKKKSSGELAKVIGRFLDRPAPTQ
jgi:hypothetical protein